MLDEKVPERAREAPAGGDFARVRRLYEHSRYVDAHRAAAAFGPYREWSSPDARTLAGRLVRELGAPRLGRAFIFHTHRRHPEHDEAAYQYAHLLLARRGPYWTRGWLLRRGEPDPSCAPEVRASFIGLLGTCLALLRDFDAALAHNDRARRIAPDHPWVLLDRAVIEARRDRPAAALELARHALALRPGYRPALLTVADALAEEGTLEEAIEVIGAGAEQAQSYAVCSSHARLLLQVGRSRDAEAALDRALASAPLCEPALKEHIRSRQAEAAYLARRHARARERARAVDHPYEREFAQALVSLSDGDAPPRIELAVPYVRQHHVTCAPASLASVAAFYGHAVDHVQLAEEICYAGTPNQQQRDWGEANGYVAREFDVTMEAARRLLDRGHPFALGTQWSSGAHLQVVMGYDAARGTWLIRDPGRPHTVEVRAAELLEGQAWCGPRGMTLVPRARAQELADVELPHAEAWDHAHRIRRHLDAHHIDDAEEAHRVMRGAHPDHRLVAVLGLDIATYRGDRKGQTRWLDALLEMHPGTARWVTHRAASMRELESRDARIAFLSQHEDGDDPAILDALAEELRNEARTQPRAARMLRRVMRTAPADAMAYHVLADLEASRGTDPDKVLELYHFATHLEPFNEHFAQAYFEFARSIGQGDRALAWLKDRVTTARGRSSDPATTLFEVCMQTGNPEQGLEALAQCAERRPDDGELALALVRGHLATGLPEQARTWLEKAEGLEVPRVGWLVTAARTEALTGNAERAVTLLREALTLDPSREDVHAALAQMLDEHEGRDAAIEHLERALAEQPHHGGIVERLAVMLRHEDDHRACEVLRARLDRQPDDQWARRELALALDRQGDRETALTVIDMAVHWLPHDSHAHAIRGDLLLHAGRAEEAREATRRAIELNVDNGAAIADLPDETRDPERIREDLRFVHGLLLERVSDGDGIRAFAEESHWLEPAERVARLRALAERHPDVPWAADEAIRAIMGAGDLDAAWEMACQVGERFPCVSALLLTRAELAQLRGDEDGARRALDELVRLSPRWSFGRLRLVEHLRARGADAEAARVLDEGLAIKPREPVWRTERAKLWWAEGQRDRAFAALIDALDDVSCVDVPFDQLLRFADALDRRGEVADALRAIVAAKPQAALYRFRLAQTLPSDQVDDRVTALRGALACNPRYGQAADMLAIVLAEAGRLDEAMNCCPPPEWVGPVPTPLRGRRAWLHAQAGSMDQAIGEMRAILHEVPSYDWGRRILADWYEKLERWDEFAAEAEQLVALTPNDAVAHLYLGDAREQASDREGALDAFRRAVRLDPSDEYGASRLFDMLLEGLLHDEAAEVVERIAPLQREGTVRSMRVRLMVVRHQLAGAEEELDRLCGTKATVHELQSAIEALATSPWGGRATLRVVEEWLEREDVESPDALARAWCNVCDRREPWAPGRVLARHRRQAAAGRAAIFDWVERLAERGSKLRLLFTWLRHGHWLARNDQWWGAMGYALCTAGFHWLTIAWLRGHAARERVQAWMLTNLVVASWAVGLGRHAGRTAAAGLALDDPESPKLLGPWHALDQALHGEPEGARGMLMPLADQQLAWQRALNHMTEAVLFARGPGRSCSMGELTEGVGACLRRAREEGADAQRDLRRALARTRRFAIAQRPWWQRPMLHLWPDSWW